MNQIYRPNTSNERSALVRAAQRLVPGTLLVALALVLTVPAQVLAGAIVPNLGTAGSFGVLGGSTVTNTGPTIVNGNVGVSPGTAVTGFPPGIVNGTIHAGDMVASQAQSDAAIAYNTAAGQACGTNLSGQDLGGLTLIPGVYCFDSSAQLTGQLTLDGQGNPNSVFIFQIASTLTTASNARVLLINGAQPCNVFWQVGSSAVIGTNTRFAGNILALTSITLNTGATTSTGLYALNGAVTLDTNAIQACGFVPAATVTPTSTAVATVTAVPPTASATQPATNTAVPAATNTPAVRPTNVATATPQPAATGVPTQTPAPGATNTPGPGNTAVPSSTAVPSTTTVAGATATNTPAGMVTATAVGTAATTPVATGTTAAATAASVSTPTPAVAIAGRSSGGTELAAGPTPLPFLPRTGGGHPQTAALALLLGALLLLVGLNTRMLFRKAHIKVSKDKA